MPPKGVILKIITSRWFWIAIIAIFAFFVIRRYWPQISRWFQTSDIDKSLGESDKIPENIADKPSQYPYSSEQEIETLAQEMYNGIYATVTEGSGYIIQKLNEANQLTDQELQYLSQFYRKFVTKGNWLYTDIDDEWMPFTTIDETIMTRLVKVGEKG